MSDKSSIEWTATVHEDGSVTPGATWNPVRGCVKVSAGCKHCYAETFAERFRGVQGHPYEQGFDLRLVPEKLVEPLTWKKPRRVFVNSMSDLFQDGVPDSFIDQVFAVMGLANQHTFQLLTKRPDRMREYVARLARSIVPIEKAAREMGHSFAFEGLSVLRWPIPNVWLGVSIENQHFADERIPVLLQTPAVVRFISAEPLLGPVDLEEYLPSARWTKSEQPMDAPLSWVIVGGESGPQARPCDLAWARHLIVQCQYFQTPVFVKQLGAKPFDGARQSCAAETCVVHDYAKLNLRDRKGGDDMAEWPSDLQVREFPEVHHDP